MGKLFGIKIAHSDFTSNYSNAIAAKVGYVIDRKFMYVSIISIYFVALIYAIAKSSS